MDTIIVNAKVFNRGRFQEDHGVAIRGGEIITVAPSKELKDLDCWELLDFSGDYLVPG